MLKLTTFAPLRLCVRPEDVSRKDAKAQKEEESNNQP
jgi:hypothetical protein